MAEVAITPDIADAVYATYADEALKLDIYLPRGIEQRGVIAYFFGGGWQSGSKKTIKKFVLAQLQRGYAIAAIDYSLSDKAHWPVQGQQAKAAIRWLRANAGTHNLAADRIIAMGNSAGGHMAGFLSMAGATGNIEFIESGNKQYSEQVQGFVGWYGVYDLTEMLSRNEPFNPTSPEVKLLGCGQSPSDCAAKARSASPTTYATSTAPPVYLLHGTADGMVPFSQSRQLAARLQQLQVPVALELNPGYQHGDPRYDDAPARRGFESFIDNLTSAKAKGAP